VTSLAAIFYASSPWLLGVILSLNLTLRSHKHLGLCLVGAGIGGYFSYLFIAATLWAGDQLGFNILSPPTLHVLSTLIFLCVAGLISAGKDNCSKLLPDNGVTATNGDRVVIILLLAVYVALILIAFVQTLWTPTQSWDSFSFWRVGAHAFLEHSENGSETPFSAYETYRHPMTLPLISAWSAWATLHAGGVISGDWPWILVWLSCSFVVIGFALSLGNTPQISLVLGVISLTMPLGENHALLAGYGEIWLGAGLLITVAMLALAMTTGIRIFVAIGAATAFSLIFIKNTGPFYAFLPLLTFLTLMLYDKNKKLTALVAVLITSFLYFAWEHGIQIKVLNNSIGFNPNVHYMVFAGKRLDFILPSLSSLFENQYFSWVAKSSFSTLPLAAMCLLGSVMINPTNLAQKYVVATITLGLFCMVASQFTEYGFSQATPLSDIGNSRFSLPIFYLVPIGVAYFTTLVNQDKKNPELFWGAQNR
jgi:hypothetical protein